MSSADQTIDPERIDAWSERAEANVEKWGLQSFSTLMLAVQEEFGELAQAYLEAWHEDGDPERIQAELDDLVPLLIQLQWVLDRGERYRAEVDIDE